MKKLAFLVVPLIVLLCSCGGADKNLNSYYHIPDNHPKTEEAINRIKNEYIPFEHPKYSIVRYTDLKDDSTTVVKTIYYKYNILNRKLIRQEEMKKTINVFPIKYMWVHFKVKDRNSYKLVKVKFFFDEELEYWSDRNTEFENILREKYGIGADESFSVDIWDRDDEE